jgi:hypothetical protein
MVSIHRKNSLYNAADGSPQKGIAAEMIRQNNLYRKNQQDFVGEKPKG